MKYIGFYDTLNNSKEDRHTSLAATNKMDYIISILNGNGYDVEVISPSWTKGKEYLPGKSAQINNKTTLKLFPSLPWGNKGQKALSLLYNKAVVFLYLFFRIKSGEQVIVYHSLALMNTILFLKKLKKIRLILEVEEIYTDVGLSCKHLKRKEFDFFLLAEKFIFSTELLSEKLNKQGKPHAIIYGTYYVEYPRNVRFDDARIHVVYAGTFDPRKGGASAAAAAEFLDENYHVHIIGFGTPKDKETLLQQIAQTSQRTKCKVTYDGLLKGEEFITFLQKCDIGLSTQTPDAEFNETSFPSKVLTYMANGLRVVSIRIRALAVSDVNKLIFYYDENTPQQIAAAIKSVNLSDKYDIRAKVNELNSRFIDEMKEILELPNGQI